MIAQIRKLNEDCVKISGSYLSYFLINKPSKSVTAGPGRVGPVHHFKRFFHSIIFHSRRSAGRETHGIHAKSNISQWLKVAQKKNSQTKKSFSRTKKSSFRKIWTLLNFVFLDGCTAGMSPWIVNVNALPSPWSAYQVIFIQIILYLIFEKFDHNITFIVLKIFVFRIFVFK